MKYIRLIGCGVAFAQLKCAAVWWTLIARLRFWLNGIVVGRGLLVTGPLHLHVHRTAEIRIGDDCRIHSGFSHNPVGGYRRTGIWVGRHALLTIGSGVRLSNTTIVCCQDVTIEDEARIGGDCRIYDTDFHSVSAEKRLCTPDRGVQKAAVRLGRRCFIGGHATLLKGVKVGDEAVVGAGAVVAREVPAREVWAGNPARRIGAI